MLIQWYPGHMAKARRMLQDNLKVIDVVVELVDARAPCSTRNPDFENLFQEKKRIIILNKADLADPAATKQWVQWYANAGIPALSFISLSGNRKQVIQMMEEAAAEKVEQMRRKGVRKTVRVMVAGIPNVGKSMFINRISGAARAKVGDKPGVTRGKQWVKITPLLELMDTPGLLWPKLDNALYAQRLAFLGSIKDDIMDVERLATLLLATLRQRSADLLRQRYACITPELPEELLLNAVCESRGFRLPEEAWDTQRAAHVVLNEYRAGRIGRITLDRPGENGEVMDAEDIGV